MSFCPHSRFPVFPSCRSRASWRTGSGSATMLSCGIRVGEWGPFHKTLPRSSAFINWISVRIYETDCIQILFCFSKIPSIFLPPSLAEMSAKNVIFLRLRLPSVVESSVIWVQVSIIQTFQNYNGIISNSWLQCSKIC